MYNIIFYWLQKFVWIWAEIYQIRKLFPPKVMHLYLFPVYQTFFSVASEVPTLSESRNHTIKTVWRGETALGRAPRTREGLIRVPVWRTVTICDLFPPQEAIFPHCLDEPIHSCQDWCFCLSPIISIISPLSTDLCLSMVETSIKLALQRVHRFRTAEGSLDHLHTHIWHLVDFPDDLPMPHFISSAPLWDVDTPCFHPHIRYPVTRIRYQEIRPGHVCFQSRDTSYYSFWKPPLREWAQHPSLWRSSTFDYFHSLPFSPNRRQALLQWSIECGVVLLLTYRDEAGALESSDPQREFCPYIFMFFLSCKISVDALEFCSWTISQQTGQFPKKYLNPSFPKNMLVCSRMMLVGVLAKLTLLSVFSHHQELYFITKM